MVKLTVTALNGESRLVDGEDNRTVMESIRDAGIGDLLALCGGCCSCATCHVYVDANYADRLSSMTVDEDALLSASSYRTARSRLSCQLRISDSLDGMAVTLAPHD